MSPYSRNPDSAGQLLFVRHGATDPNVAGLRCGGDLDTPLNELGRRQALEAATRIRELGLCVGVIFTSALRRAYDTAAIISAHLPGIEVVIEPALAERFMGAWNLRPIGETQKALEQRMTPPGGESDSAFIARVAGALENIMPRLPERPLVVASKGVARAMGEVLGMPRRTDLSNGELAHFDVAAFSRRVANGGPR